MALHGSLDSFTIPDVLRLLAATEKTGYLALTGDRGNGGTWLDSGQLVGGKSDRTATGVELVDILFELMRFDVGEFSFEEGRECTAPDEPADVDALVGAAESMISELRRLEEIVPSFDRVVELVEILPTDKVELNQGLWRTVVAAGRCRTVGEIGASLELGDLDLMRAVRDVIEAELASLVEVSESVMPFDDGRAETLTADATDDEEVMVAESSTDPFQVEGGSEFDTVLAGEVGVLDADDRAESWALRAPAPPLGDEFAAPGVPIAPAAFGGSAIGDGDEHDDDPLSGGGDWTVGIEVPAQTAESDSALTGSSSTEPVALMEDESTAAADMARQLASLSPAAAKAVAAAAEASNDEEREAAMDALREANVPPESVAEFLGIADG